MKIYKMFCDFGFNKELMEFDPPFEAEILLDEESGLFIGRGNDYDTIKNVPSRGKLRYMAGYYGPNGKNGEGLAFYKFHCRRLNSPRLYVVKNIGEPEYWALKIDVIGLDRVNIPFSPIPYRKVGEAQIRMEEMEYSDEKAARIRKRYDNVNRATTQNSVALRNLDLCKEYVM